MTVLDFGGSNALRLLSNLVLTRLLFPEAFGLMALVQVFNTGLQMFSDIGIRASIMQSPNGDDPSFLNTAWTLQILRGIGLWLASCAISWPVAAFYGEPLLHWLLPVVGLNALISGFMSTNMFSANRHLQLGRQTMISLAAQVVALTLNVGLAWALQSVWALVWGGLLSTVFTVAASHLLMPGIRNRPEWNRAWMGELIGFGKFIFLSTIAGFLINQSDRAILGKFIALDQLGIYSVAYFLGSLPLVFSRAALGKILGPLYRMRHPSKSEENRRRIHKARRATIGGLIAVTVPFAYAGPWLIDVLYDDRYLLAGPMVVLFAFVTPAQLISIGYGGAFLASGDSRRLFYLTGVTAVIQVILMIAATMQFGIVGAIFAPGVAALLVYPLRTAYLQIYNANDTPADLVMLVASAVLNGLACWLHWDEIARLL